MFKNLLNNVIITLVVFVIMWLVSLIPISLEFLNPIQNTFKDFDLTDIVFSRLRDDVPSDKNIVLVNLGKIDRQQMADVLNAVQKQKPKVVGIDAFYRKLKGENGQASAIDSLLADAFKNTKNLVMVSKLEGYNEKKKQYDTITKINDFFGQHTFHAYANLTTTGEGNMQDFLTCRTFVPQTKALGKTEIAFAVKIAQLFNPEKAKKFLARNNVSEYINYKRNIDIQRNNPNKKNQEIGYMVIDHSQILGDEIASDALKDKIVVIGYMGETIFEKSFDDKFYTPLNQNYVGKSTPDMFGVVVHANIISMILAEDYIDEMNDFLNIFLAFVVGVLVVSLFGYFHRYLGYWYDMIVLVTQFLLSLGLFTLAVFMFQNFNLRVNITLALGSVIICGIFVEIYYSVIYKMMERYRKRMANGK